MSSSPTLLCFVLRCLCRLSSAQRAIGFICAIVVALIGSSNASGDEPLDQWTMVPAQSKAVEVEADRVVMQSSSWGYIVSPSVHEDVEVAWTMNLQSPATQFEFFGSSWSAWPDPKFEDRGFEAAVVLRRANDDSSGYRLQFSSAYDEVALVRYPDGGYVASVEHVIETETPIKVKVSLSHNKLSVCIDGKEILVYDEELETPLGTGHVAFGVSSSAKVEFSNVVVNDDPAIGVVADCSPLPEARQGPRFTCREWLGGRLFVFDQDEPILQLHNAEDPSMFAKLAPGYKPLLTFDSHWGLENQGAFLEAKVTWSTPDVHPLPGERLQVKWTARHNLNRFQTSSELVVGFDSIRQVYTYDITSELVVLPGEPFLFRYGFDFEHHTPLDPFRWQYLLVKNAKGEMTYRPLSPFDPGVLSDIQTYHGLRVWHGRSSDDYRISPAVEYRIQPEWISTRNESGDLIQRKLNTAVCAAFYDTGVSFGAVTAQPGDTLRVEYRYTGYTIEETNRLFAEARVQDNPRIDPTHHFVFLREQWPTIRFNDSLAMDKPWWGGRPLLSGHNARPTYELATVDGQQVLKLPPVSNALAPVGPAALEPGRYLVTVRVKSNNVHGPGGRIEVLTLKKPDLHGNGYLRMDESNIAEQHVRYFGNGSSDWQEMSFDFQLKPDATALAIGLGNEGTGEVFVESISVLPLAEDAVVSPSQLVESNALSSMPGVLWDLRMEEGSGYYVYNYGGSSYRNLELANIDWVSGEERPAIRFAENDPARADYPALGILDLNVRHETHGSSYLPVRHGAFGLAGHHGGGEVRKGLTLCAWIKPAAEMGRSTHQGKGDIIGYGARRFILSLSGQTAPYTLQGRINVNSRVESTATLEAERWYHVALVAEPSDSQWLVRLYLDGETVGEGISDSLANDQPIPDSLILGGELFYLHDAYYRGLMSSVLVFDRALAAGEIREVMNRK